VGVWKKPLKFMASTTVFAVTTVWLSVISNTPAAASTSFPWIAGLVTVSSLLEVGYITWQAAGGRASHYNRSDSLHALLFGLMGVVAVALTGSQLWLAWVIWTHTSGSALSVTTLGVLTGLVLTFLLSTASGMILAGRQPAPGPGLPVFGWKRYNDLRPSHFLGVHAQQLVPAAGLLAEGYLGASARPAFAVFAVLYVLAWSGLTWMGVRTRATRQLADVPLVHG
jgi:hypothetical protein